MTSLSLLIFWLAFIGVSLQAWSLDAEDCLDDETISALQVKTTLQHRAFGPAIVAQWGSDGTAVLLSKSISVGSGASSEALAMPRRFDGHTPSFSKTSFVGFGVNFGRRMWEDLMEGHDLSMGVAKPETSDESSALLQKISSVGARVKAASHDLGFTFMMMSFAFFCFTGLGLLCVRNVRSGQGHMQAARLSTDSYKHGSQWVSKPQDLATHRSLSAETMGKLDGHKLSIEHSLASSTELPAPSIGRHFDVHHLCPHLGIHSAAAFAIDASVFQERNVELDFSVNAHENQNPVLSCHVRPSTGHGVPGRLALGFPGVLPESLPLAVCEWRSVSDATSPAFVIQSIGQKATEFAFMTLDHRDMATKKTHWSVHHAVSGKPLLHIQNVPRAPFEVADLKDPARDDILVTKNGHGEIARLRRSKAGSNTGPHHDYHFVFRFDVAPDADVGLVILSTLSAILVQPPV